jgi:Cellulase (glycosyl hydrolase family 5)
MRVPARLVLVTFAALLLAPVGVAVAAVRMPVGFYDDPSFRWSAARQENLQAAASAGSTVIHTTASWPGLAPTRPADAADGSDPAYQLSDLDDLVAKAALYHQRVMIDITGTPKWANGGKTPNRMPTRLSDLTTFANMLASRYNGLTGHGTVGLYSVWNEPNLQLFLSPQYAGKKIVGPANYAKLYKAAYAGIKAGNPAAHVAIGETSARGRDKPLATASASVAPATFARLVAQTKGLRFDAWAHHPYPSANRLPPTQKVRYPNVALSTMPQFEKDLKKWFHRSVPIWITEYGHETKPGDPQGVSPAIQAKYAKQALTIAKNDPNVQMFIWFTFRDSPGNPWQSGLRLPSGANKPSYNAFSSLARAIDGTTVAGKAGVSPRIPVYVPYLNYYAQIGSTIGVAYKVFDGSKQVAVGQASASLAGDQSVTFTANFKPVKRHTYRVQATLVEQNGHAENRTATVTTA